MSGIRVVDLGMFVAGPYASVPLADLGADVIKIEPLTGDPNRGVWRAYACCNRGKRSIAIDLKHEEGLAIAQQICSSAHIVHHNFRPGVADRLGLGYEKLREENPSLIYLEASAYGDTGPMSAMPGFDMILQALCGHEASGAGEDNDPLWLRWAPVDFTGGYLGTIGMLASIYRKQKTGEGGLVQANLLDAGMYIISELIRGSDGKFSGITPMNSSMTGIHPAQALYQTSDGWISIVARSAEQAEALANVLGAPEVAGTPPDTWGNDVQGKFATALAALNTADAVTLLRNKGIWTEPCRTDVEQSIFNNRAWQELGLVREYPHEKIGKVKQLGNMARLSNTEPSPERAGRVAGLGEDTREILGQFGYTRTQVDDLYARNIVN